MPRPAGPGQGDRTQGEPGWGAAGTWEPGSQPASAFLLSQPVLCCHRDRRPPLLRAGGSSGLASRGDGAKALVSSAKPRALEVRDGEARLGHIPVSAQAQGEKTGSEPEEGSERSSGEDVGEESERQVGSAEVMVIEGGKGHPEEESGMKEDG